jgi:hypothetical protein
MLSSLSKVSVMAELSPRDELVRLRKAQIKARQDEVFNGLYYTELAEYECREKRINELERGAIK